MRRRDLLADATGAALISNVPLSAQSADSFVEVFAGLKRIKAPVIRWPGGCFADHAHNTFEQQDAVRLKELCFEGAGARAPFQLSARAGCRLQLELRYPLRTRWLNRSTKNQILASSTWNGELGFGAVNFTSDYKLEAVRHSDTILTCVNCCSVAS